MDDKQRYHRIIKEMAARIANLEIERAELIAELESRPTEGDA